MSSRRGFLRQLGSGAVIAAAVPIVGSSLVALPGAQIYPVFDPLSPVDFHKVLGAVRDVYSSEILLSALPVMRLDKFTTGRFGYIQRREDEEWENNLKAARLACQMDKERVMALPAPKLDLKKRRRFFDLGWLRAA